MTMPDTRMFYQMLNQSMSINIKKTLYQEIHAANVLINKPVRLHCITIPRQDLVEMVNGPL